ncbi:MAG: response regulator transcription factor [Bryobacteraceae bacterium]|jgi:two-component system KDP operon response regulator KdpE
MPSLNGNILVTDDDSDLRWVLGTTLGALGFGVVSSSNGEQALLEVGTRRFDAVVLDVNMPGMGGIETCRRIRKKAPLLPILMLTVRDRERDKIEALDAGADDYITKPFSVPELAARLRSAVRRFNTESRDAGEFGPTGTPIVIGDIELDPTRRTVRKSGSLLRLTPKEFELLHYLMKHPGRPVAHTALLQAVWGDDCALQTEYLRTFVSQLRKKLEDDPSNPQYLLTELSFGYRFREDA